MPDAVASTTVSLMPLIEALIGLAAAALLGLGTLAIRRLTTWLRLSEDDKVRGYLETALENGIALARQKVLERAATAGTAQIRSAVAAEASRYVIERVPDALKRFGVTERGVKDLVAARLAHYEPARPR